MCNLGSREYLALAEETRVSSLGVTEVALLCKARGVLHGEYLRGLAKLRFATFFKLDCSVSAAASLLVAVGREKSVETLLERAIEERGHVDHVNTLLSGSAVDAVICRAWLGGKEDGRDGRDKQEHV